MIDRAQDTGSLRTDWLQGKAYAPHLALVTHCTKFMSFRSVASAIGSCASDRLLVLLLLRRWWLVGECLAGLLPSRPCMLREPFIWPVA